MAENFALSSTCDNKKDLGKEVMAKGNDLMKERKAVKGKEKEYDKKNDDQLSVTDETPAATDGGSYEGPHGEKSSFIHQNLASENCSLPGQDEPEPSYTRSSPQNGSFKQILSGLCEGNGGSQLDLLYQLNDLLSVATVDSLSDSSVDSFVPLLIGFLNYELHNPDTMLLAARALTHLCDMRPSWCAAVVKHGAIPSFCAGILTIEYIDVAEQALQALEKISHEHPTACLRAGGLIAVLLNLNFFSTRLQRVAVSTAANICTGLRSDASDCVIEAIPTLINILQNQDSKVVEHASACLMQIVETFASVPEKLDILCSQGLISQVAFLLDLGNSTCKSLDSQTSFSTSTQTRLVRVLSTCARGSAAAAGSLLLLGISRILKDSLAENGLVSNTILPPALLYEIITLINELPPPMLKSTLPISNNGISESEILSEKGSAVMASIDTGEAGHGAPEETGVREKLLLDQPDLLVQFGLDLFPALVQVCGSRENLAVQKKCLAAIVKLLGFSAPEFFGTLLMKANISSFPVGVLASKNASILITALQIAEIIMQKNQHAFAPAFVKEGVLHAIDELITSFNPWRSGHRLTVVERAKCFREKHFSRCFSLSNEGITETVWTLKRLCAKLDSECAEGGALISGTNQGFMAASMSEILKELGSEDGVSAFEFEESGIVSSLLSYFGVGNVSKTKRPDPNILTHEAPQRFKQFIELSLPLNSTQKAVPLITLVRKLKNALASAERFPAYLQGATDDNGALGDVESNEYSRELKEDFTDEGDASYGDEYDQDCDEDYEENCGEEEYDEDHAEHRGKSAISNEDYEDNFGGDEYDEDDYDYDDNDYDNDYDEQDSDQEPTSEWTKPPVHDIIVRDGEDIKTAGTELIYQPSCFSGPRTASLIQRGAGPECSWQVASILESTIFAMKLPRGSEKKASTRDHLFLLRILEQLNRLAPRFRAQNFENSFVESGNLPNLAAWQLLGPVVPTEEFLSSKLTSRLAREMHDALEFCRGRLPTWCHQLIKACPFLFPFETRMQYFHSTAFGLSRAFQWLQQHRNGDRPAHNIYPKAGIRRLRRQKVRVSRHYILDSAAKVMELYAGQNAVIEVEYFSEIGTGLGPTLEFYTLVSHELQRSSLDMWRTDFGRDDAGGVEMANAEGEKSYAFGMNHVHARQGLFPRPWFSGVNTVANGKYAKVIGHFRLLGQVMAKALQDGRMLDLPLSSTFYKLVLGKQLDSNDIGSVDPELGRTLQEMRILARRKRFLESLGSDGRQAVEALRFRDSRIEDLFLDFTLPGYPDYSLKPGGSEEFVNLENLEEYVSLVVDATLNKGIILQFEAFCSGFNQVFKLSTLQIFAEDELETLLCGRLEQWKPETLPELLNFDHGYTASSPPIRHLLELMGEFTPSEQQEFLRFVTGAPKLPPGGLSVLSPKLTIVRKHPLGVSVAGAATLESANPATASSCETTEADQDLPTVMTCANYLKLPPYSCKKVMRNRLMFAIREGQGSFELS